MLSLITTREAARVTVLVVSVCLSDDNFWKHRHRKFISAHVVYLQGIWVKFIYEGQRFKVTTTGWRRINQTINFCCCWKKSCKPAGSRLVNRRYRSHYRAVSQMIVARCCNCNRWRTHWAPLWLLFLVLYVHYHTCVFCCRNRELGQQM